MQVITKSQKETEEIAINYAKKLKGGDILALIGDLGSGKTAFAKGLAKGLGIKEEITSPTFVLLKQYLIHKSKIRNPKKARLVHVDCYRITNIKDAEPIGLIEYLDEEDSIVIIEWAENIKSILPSGTKYIKFEHLGGDERKIIIQ